MQAGLFKEKYYYSSSESTTFLILKEYEHYNVVYVYSKYNEEKIKEALSKNIKDFIKPTIHYLIKKDISLKEFFHKSGYFSSEQRQKYEDTELEAEHLFATPEPYVINGNITYKVNIDKELLPEVVEHLKNKKTLRKGRTVSLTSPIILLGENPNFKLNADEEQKEVTNYVSSGWRNQQEFTTYQGYCCKCQKRIPLFTSTMDMNKSCDCGNNTHVLISKSFKEYREKNYNLPYYSPFSFRKGDSVCKDSFYHLAVVENGIILYKITREILTKKDTIIEDWSLDYSIEHIIGKSIITYKHLKKGKKPCDVFEALNLNSKTINETPVISYANYENFDDFALNNEKFLKMSGFLDILKYSSEKLKLESFFVLFLGIMNKYPIMEQIVKVGHAKLFFIIYHGIMESCSKEEIANKIKKLDGLIDKESTKGKSALRFPSYIGDYLIKKDADLAEYCLWRDLYEITNMSKEQFDNFTNSFAFSWINSQNGLNNICNILKFEYSIEKLFNYIMKQHREYEISVSQLIQYMIDYLNMCDLCEITPDKYPQDLKKQHDDMRVYFNERKQSIDDKKLGKIAKECAEYVIPSDNNEKEIGIPKLFDLLTVVFPKSESDFINEGNQQHNCVGSYPRRVKSGDCVIFFIRTKENPETSYITAECTTSGLGQCYYANNRHVYDEEILNFAKYICRKIKAGCNSGKIHALNNIE